MPALNAKSTAGTASSSASEPSVNKPVYDDDEIFAGYLSDMDETDELGDVDGHVADDERDGDERTAIIEEHTQTPTALDLPQSLPSNAEDDFPVRQPPPLKRRKLEVPARVAKAKIRDERRKKLEKALEDIGKQIKSQRMVFQAGKAGLQSYRARAIHSYLHMVLHNSRKVVDASERSAESHGFAAQYGGRQVRVWAKDWIGNRALPTSRRGCHRKSFSFLADPAICAELCSYVRSNKWAMDPAKLTAFTQNQLVPEAAKEYLREVVDKEIPQGLKRYLEVELFPRIHLKVGKGISLSTAR